MSVRVSFVAAAVVVSIGTRAQSDVIANHFKVEGRGLGNSQVLFDSTIQGNGTLDTGPLAGNFGAFSANAQARVESSTGLLRSRASSTAPFSTTLFASSRATSHWKDVLFVSGSDPHPTALRFNFGIDAVFSISNVLDSNHVARTGIALVVDDDLGPYIPGILSSPVQINQLHAFLEELPSTPLTTNADAGSSRAWDSASFVQNGGNYEFSGTFHIDSPLRAKNLLGTVDDGYLLQIISQAQTSVRAASAESNAFSTLGIQSITLTDGTPISAAGGLNFFFESGVTAVPEPNAIWLALLMMVVWGGGMRHRAITPAIVLPGAQCHCETRYPSQ